MRNVPVVAVQAFQLKCTHCGQLGEGFLSQHVCARCGMPQPVSSSEDYFSALGVEKRFTQDRHVLEKTFYDLSRALHPDRFTTAGSTAKNLSLSRMSFLNQAYGTLKKPELLRAYLLQLEGFQVSPENKGIASKMAIPISLAESWFEIQDLLTEDPLSAGKRLTDFEGELAQLKQKSEDELLLLEKTYDANPARQILEKLAQAIHTQSYLKSMERDVERIKKNAYSN